MVKVKSWTVTITSSVDQRVLHQTEASWAQLSRQRSAKRKAICTDPVIIYGSYNRCERPNQYMPSCFHLKCIIHNSTVCMHVVLNSRLDILLCTFLYWKCPNPQVSVKKSFFLHHHQILHNLFPLIEWMCIMALHLTVIVSICILCFCPR